MNNIENKWMRAAVPALLIHCSIGTVYCWSLLKGGIAEYIGRPKGEVEWAFSIAIFFLGMSAAFAGRAVEKDIHKSSLIAAVCFAAGMAGTGFFIQQKSLIGIFLTYGVLMGIGCGIGYLSPVKTLMLWFKNNKGLATGIAVAGFGLAKVIASPIIEMLLGATNADGTLVDPTRLYKLFYILAVVYFIMMFTGHLLLKKPSDWVEVSVKMKKGENILDIFKNKTFIGIWLMFFINITCGLALISQEKDLLHFIGFGAVGVISSLTALFNASGRLGFASFGDRLKDRNTIYIWIFGLSIAATALTLFGERHQQRDRSLSHHYALCRQRRLWRWFLQPSPTACRPLRDEQHQHNPRTGFIRLGFCRTFREPIECLHRCEDWFLQQRSLCRIGTVFGRSLHQRRHLKNKTG